MDKLPNESVQDEFKAGNNSLEGALDVNLVATLKEVVLFSELVLDFSNEEVAPVDLDVLGHRLVMRILHANKLFEFSWKLKYCLVGVHVTVG